MQSDMSVLCIYLIQLDESGSVGQASKTNKRQAYQFRTDKQIMHLGVTQRSMVWKPCFFLR